MATEFSRQSNPPRRIHWPWLLVGVAWILAILATLTGQRLLIDHHFLLEESGFPWPLALAVFLVGWQVMIAAMMMPTSTPFITTCIVASLAGPHAPRLPHRAIMMFLLGYAGLWTVFGVLAFAGDTLIHRLVDAWPWLASHASLIGAATLALAGVFQFSSQKLMYLAHCRARPEALAGEDAMRARSAYRLGARHAVDSIGCCWALMLVLFGIGVGGLGWMVALTGIMCAETLVSEDVVSGRTRQAIGIVLIVLAGVWLAHPDWLVGATVV
ncbi:MAG TPA: DUF2182 domain-containing protein [Ktedonobacterales bacterium]